jgi:hypothetical protein
VYLDLRGKAKAFLTQHLWLLITNAAGFAGHGGRQGGTEGVTVANQLK